MGGTLAGRFSGLSAIAAMLAAMAAGGAPAKAGGEALVAPKKVFQVKPLALRHGRRSGLARDLIQGGRGASPQGQRKEIEMKANEGNLDRALRVAAGLVLVGLAATGAVGLWGYVGAVPLLTGALGWCPLYSVLGISTCPAGRR